MRKKFTVLTLVFFSILFWGCSTKEHQQTELDLAGTWNYRLDSLDVGMAEKWQLQDFKYKIDLPAALRDYDIGNKPSLKTQWTGSIYDSSWYFNPAMKKYRSKESIKFPFWLTPDTRYVGKAWFQKTITIPDSWSGKNLELMLERPHWQTKVWLDSTEIGTDNSLSVPHKFIIPASYISSGEHKLTVQVDNAIRDIDPGINSHSISDHTQGNWNGIVGQMKLDVLNSAYFNTIKILPDVKNNKVAITVDANGMENNISIAFKILDKATGKILQNKELKWNSSNELANFTLEMGEDYTLWSEFNPALYILEATLKNDERTLDTKRITFGMRDFSIEDKKFTINGTQIFLRGTTECSVFPLTGYPPTSKEEWATIYEKIKSFGLNHMRFHSYCPPEAAFEAADEAGIYLQVEGPSWAKYSTTLGDGKPLDDYLMKETKRIIDTYGNHPSFVMMAYGNEPSGNYVPYLENWVDHFREYDSQRVFTGASTGGSWSIIENSDFIVRAPPRGLEWKDKKPNSTFDYRTKTENQERPYVTFEMGQWCAFPNFEEIPKYKGALKAKNFELFKEDLNDHHMADLADEFLMASGKLQALCYKQEIEATMRTPNLAGYQLLGLNDFSGQGTALVGVLDAFWDEKGYITSEEFKAFNDRVVPLVRFDAFTFKNTEAVQATIEVANFSGNVLQDAKVHWSIENEEQVTFDEGSFTVSEIPVGNANVIGKISSSFEAITKAQKLVVKVRVNGFENSWNIWVYPQQIKIEKPEEILIAHQADDQVLEALENGKSVLLLAAGNVENGEDVIQYFTPAFWNTSWFRMRPPHTTGIYIRDEHPVFKAFPTDYYSDLQWWEIANKQQVMNLENFDPEFEPIVQPIDTWFLNRRLAMLFEAQIGKGKLMVCSVDLEQNLDQRIVAKHLKNSILNYMVSDAFNPESKVEWNVVQELFEKKEREGWKSYVSDNP
ncbi:MAG: sugar-binding domain-containing protein [Leeuwenhoekiella sp.]|mgnify:CR=1 FL=1|jgi:hypothetical protein|uniref:sugar-binding domain-containing protein n=1 Tax=Leeuwenhoekiella TaxID=283735 RepID=UPI000C610177|nr:MULTISPECIES: sugar-binding domain-containing protein [Leeuwenhoekiella]MAO45455.1 beta-glucuronidase [Leeuwenhoekiella sp.]HCW63364.1 beta-glucuronidase [Leeuwenhoekiella sp.]|tara:strand:+ start:3934 stop:6789 length:2856 start_codon:yes stop_codon:yes gene_type:complete